MFNRNLIIYILLLLMTPACLLLGQTTTEWKLIWNQNPEDTTRASDDDIQKYIIFRNEPGNDNFARYDSTEMVITNNDTAYADTFFIDKDLQQKGKRYTYKIKAVNQYGESADSKPVSAAIPNILFPEYIYVPPDTTFRINLDLSVQDEDDSSSALNWSFEAPMNSMIEVQTYISGDYDWAEITSKHFYNFYSSDSILFTVSDRDTFTDERYLVLKPEPLNLSVSNTILLYDSSVVYNLNDCIKNKNYNKDNYKWNYELSPHLILSESDSILNIRVDKSTVNDIENLEEVMGDNYFIVEATSPYNETIQFHDTATVTVKSNVTLNKPDFSLDEDGSAIFPRDTLISSSTYHDFDSSKISVTPVESKFLSFSARNDSLFIVSADSANWFGSDTITFIYSDPSWDSLKTEVYFTIDPVNDPPELKNFPESVTLHPGNDFSESFDLDDYVFDPDPSDNFRWDIEFDDSDSANQKIDTSLVNNVFRISASENSEEYSTSIFFKVLDDSGTSDSTILSVLINPNELYMALADSFRLVFNEDSIGELNVHDLITSISLQDTTLLNWSVSERSETLDELNINTSDINDSGIIRFNDPVIENFNANGYVILTAAYSGLKETSQIDIEITAVNDPPKFTEEFLIKIANFNTIVERNSGFNEIRFDTSALVYDPDNNFNDLDWQFFSRDNKILIDPDAFHTRNALRFTFSAGWTGTDSVGITVFDPDSLSDAVGLILKVNGTEDSPDVVSVQTEQFGSPTNIAITWESSFNAQSYVRYGLDDSLNQETPQNTTLQKIHFHLLENLTPNSEYIYQTVMTDSMGNEYLSRILTFTTGELGEINVFPNPYRAGEFTQNDFINFTGLPEKASIRIFNLMGEPVFSIDEVTSIYRWRTVNNHEKNVQSGIYLYVIKDQDNKKIASGKIVIIR